MTIEEIALAVGTDPDEVRRIKLTDTMVDSSHTSTSGIADPGSVARLSCLSIIADDRASCRLTLKFTDVSDICEGICPPGQCAAAYMCNPSLARAGDTVLT